MPNILEKDIERKLRIEIEKLGGKCLKWTSQQYSGVPDRICIVLGQVWFVELKKPRNSRTTLLQMAFGRWLVTQGCNYVKIKNEEELYKLIEKIKANDEIYSPHIPSRRT
jgi:hypothetical protein